MPKSVRATQPGLYGSYRETGDTFDVVEDRHFSPVWMEEVSGQDAGVAELRGEARSLGIEVDNRWGEKRLRSEIDAALAK